MLVLQVFAFLQLLDERRFLPMIFQHLVAADMDVRRIGKQLDRFVENIFEKFERLFRRAKDFLENSPRRLNFVLVIGLASEIADTPRSRPMRDRAIRSPESR